MASLGIPDIVRKSFDQKCKETIAALGADIDVRVAYKTLGDLRAFVRLIPELQESPENSFMSFIFWAIVGQSAWAGMHQEQERWFVVNATLLQQLRKSTAKHVEAIQAAVKKDSFEAFIDAAKQFFVDMTKIDRQMTPIAAGED